jgi:hypothetical protein
MKGKAGLKRGNKLEERVRADFAHQPEKLRATADAIGAHVATGSAAISSMPFPPMMISKRSKGKY